MADAQAPLDPQILDRVKAIVRRDLRLGATAAIADDMPFFNSDADMDSLDVLLLVTSIEKEFGFKIPSQEVGRTIFESPASIARYIQQRQSGAGTDTSAAPTSAGPDLPRTLAGLPHGEPFRFVSRLTQLVPGTSAEGAWDVKGDEAFLAGHFPGRPVVPGVLIAEALAQVSGLAGARQDEAAQQGALAHVDVRFEQPVVPPASIVLKSTLSHEMGALQQFDVSAEVNGTVVARGSIALHRHAPADESKGERAQS